MQIAVDAAAAYEFTTVKTVCLVCYCGQEVKEILRCARDSLGAPASGDAFHASLTTDPASAEEQRRSKAGEAAPMCLLS